MKPLHVALAAVALASSAAPALARPGQISTVAGSDQVTGDGYAGTGGDGGQATRARLFRPGPVSAISGGGFLVLDRNTGSQRVRRVGSTGTIFSPPGPDFSRSTPFDAESIPGGGYLVSTSTTVLRVTEGGAVTVVAGSESRFGFGGDGGPATEATLRTAFGIAATPDGGVLISDTQNSRVRKVGPDGVIRTVAGAGSIGYSGDGGPAIAAQFCAAWGIDATADGGFLVIDLGAQTIRRVDARGIITTVAGQAPSGGCPAGNADGDPPRGGFAGDGGPATAALLDGPTDVAASPDGGFAFTDYGNNRVRRVDPRGVITTVAGDGTCCASGDGGLATRAQLWGPYGIDLLPGGDILFSDSSADRVRLVRNPGAEFDPGTPRAGRTAVVTPLRGRVTVSRLLRRPRLVRAGAAIDARRGRVVLEVVSRRRAGRRPAELATLRARAGRFTFAQQGRSRITTSLRPVGRLRCDGGRARRRSLTVAGGSLAKVTISARAARITAPPQGAVKVVDRCGGTRVSVARGSGPVLVRDLGRRKTVTVRPGGSYTARRRG